MKNAVGTIVFGGVLVALAAIVYVTGIVSFSAPSLPSFTSVDVELTLPEEARITKVEPINLDCRARVHAEIPVEGQRQAEAFGVVYRTDRITMHAYGDVDTLSLIHI